MTEVIRKRVPNSTDFKKIEEATRISIDEPFKEFYLKYSGVELPHLKHNLQVSYPDTKAEEPFARFSTVYEIKDIWEHVGYLKEFASHFECPRSFVEVEYLLPFAESYDGVFYVAMGGSRSGVIYHADNGDFGIGFVANDFAEFAALLQIENLSDDD